MNAIEQLKAHAGNYSGQGVNHEGEPFSADVEIRAVGQGNGVSLSFRATSLPDEMVFHDEHGLLAPAQDGSVQYFPISSNIPFVLTHEVRDADSGVELAYGAVEDQGSFREVIAIHLNPESVTFSYSWGMPGEDFGERSTVTCSRLG